jgi:hypothetical protein
VPQAEIGEGPTYRFVEWNGRAMLRARINYRRHYSPAAFQSPEFANRVAQVRLVGLGETRPEEPRAEMLPV